MGSEIILGGIVLAVTDIYIFWGLDEYAIITLAIYLIGFVVLIPFASFWWVEEEDKAGGLRIAIPKLPHAFRKNFIEIIVLCLLWPLVIPVRLFFVKGSYASLLLFVGALSLSIWTIDIATKSTTAELLRIVQQDTGNLSRKARNLLRGRADPAAIQPLLALAQNSSISRNIRTNATYALEGVENEDVFNFLFAEFTSPTSKLSDTARYVLRKYEPSKLIARLVPSLTIPTGHISVDAKYLLEKKIKQRIEQGDLNPENIAEQLVAQIRDYLPRLTPSREPSKAFLKANRKVQELTDYIAKHREDRFIAFRVKSLANLKDKVKLQAEKDKQRIWTQKEAAIRRHANDVLSLSTDVMSLLRAPVATQMFIELLDNRDLSDFIHINAAKGLRQKGAGDDVFKALKLALWAATDSAEKFHIIKSLGVIENKSAIPVLVAQLTDWRSSVQKISVTELSEFDWEPSSTVEIIHFAAAKRDKSTLLDRWEDTKTVLLRDMKSSDHNAQTNAVYTFVRLGRESILPDLVKIIHDHGHIGLARTYFHSGNKILSKAGRRWAEGHGYRVKRVKSWEARGGNARWGGK